ncbi:hypothetical protein MPDQ_003945 [Monascus purpureus]|uniref:Uncharacterized protein n=1 Tax=Monascus purpureus TaxID=5098 RepID=A0A507QYB9_MONPU|nr:hypothetical protein MPDQ_003945 [Monascus purpureus]BDD63897.1 hypothetical protein MAP00_008754 [Monascus purpureus]
MQLEEFPANRIPLYAILSHTWGLQEVSREDIQHHTATARGKTSWQKIQFACQQSLKDGLEYIWIDTCCIDKSSSAELSEALNSMFSWYKKAQVCYTYLVDVPTGCDPHKPGSTFDGARWFQRGWTLQELVAPSEMVFFSRDWVQIGTKNSLCGVLAQITLIDEDILMHRRPLGSASIARRMSWAAHRETTRPEDIAYCLMGIFSVNMPMLYGEGEKAFRRLQEEIMKQSDDQSIFAWVDREASPTSLHGLLATSPSQFAGCNDILPYQDWEPREPYTMTNRGLQIGLPLIHHDKDIYIAVLDCPSPHSHAYSSFLGIFLQRLSKADQYARTKVGMLAEVDDRGQTQTIYVRQNILLPEVEGVFPNHILQIVNAPSSLLYKMVKAFPVPDAAQFQPILSSRSTAYPTTMSQTFRLRKGPRDLCAFTSFERTSDGKGILVLLGTCKGNDVGFDALETQRPRDFSSEDFTSVSRHFQPKIPGTWIELENNFVCVKVEPRINPLTKQIGVASSYAAAKYYMVEIEIQPVQKSNNPIQILADAVEASISRQGRSINPQRSDDIQKVGSQSKISQKSRKSGWRQILKQDS